MAHLSEIRVFLTRIENIQRGSRLLIEILKRKSHFLSQQEKEVVTRFENMFLTKHKPQ